MDPYLPTMSCTSLTDDRRLFLSLLAQGQPVPDDLARVLEELRRWGWVTGAGELTGAGWAHVEQGMKGRLGIR